MFYPILKPLLTNSPNQGQIEQWIPSCYLLQTSSGSTIPNQWEHTYTNLIPC